jgi:type IV pilus assembly protein PilY1
MFYRGQAVHFGKPPNIKSIPQVTDAAEKNYISPIEFECQKNFIVLLTDGDPVDDADGDTVINTLLDTASGLTLGDCSFPADDCLDELAEFGYTVDNATLALGNDIPNDQNIITYTVGFATDQTLLSSAANKGGGKYYTADDPMALATAFTKIITEIQAVNTTFTAPAVSVNAFNRVTHRKELYFTLFKPALTPHWPGNVKRFELDYVLDGSGNPVDSDGDGIPDEPEILDVNGVPAVDPNTGFFKASATSYWTPAADVPDGDETHKGGAASNLPEIPSNRNVYTNVGGVSDLTDASNALHESNALITSAMLDLSGGPGEPTRDVLLQWARGVDTWDDDDDGSATDGRKEMGDPLHAKPLLVTYGGTEASPDITMFAITNDGYLHAIDVDDGTEVFAFVPKELLSQLKIVHENVGAASHNYGLDGGIEVWVKDHNDNGVIETPDTDGNLDHVYLYFGQRRGGTNYYALDVTNRSAPQMLWHIQGAVAGDFLELADTWSTPVYHRIKVKSGATLVPKDVIVFGGGYDAEQDNNATRLADDEGRAVYMVDAVTGSLLWWAGKSGLVSPTPDLQLAGMDYSIPSQVRVLDVNTDGFADRMYVGDMGGQLWRFDIDNSTVDLLANRITGGMIADLQKINPLATPGAADNRRFYYPPDVALNLVPDGPDFLSLAVGSGYRAHPLDTAIEDRMYMVKDYDIYDPPTSGSPPAITYTAITEDDLDDRTSLGVASTKPRGWYIKLNNVDSGVFEGEKVLAEPLTFDGAILFTTFTPVASASQSACSPSQGTARLYQVSVYDASPLQNMDGLGDDTTLTRSDRSLTLVRTGIPPEVTILFPGLDQAEPVALVGAEKVGLTLSQTPVKTYWFQEQN